MLWCVRTRVCMCWSLLCAVHYASSATTSTVCENTGSYHYYRTGRPLYSEGTSHSADSGSNLVGDKFAVAQSAKRGRKAKTAKCEMWNWQLGAVQRRVGPGAGTSWRNRARHCLRFGLAMASGGFGELVASRSGMQARLRAKTATFSSELEERKSRRAQLPITLHT